MFYMRIVVAVANMQHAERREARRGRVAAQPGSGVKPADKPGSVRPGADESAVRS